MYENIAAEAAAAINELLEIAKPAKGQLIVIGCSSRNNGR